MNTRLRKHTNKDCWGASYSLGTWGMNYSYSRSRNGSRRPDRMAEVLFLPIGNYQFESCYVPHEVPASRLNSAYLSWSNNGATPVARSQYHYTYTPRFTLMSTNLFLARYGSARALLNVMPPTPTFVESFRQSKRTEVCQVIIICNESFHHVEMTGFDKMEMNFAAFPVSHVY
ncbi:hypothetical protein IQ07DRAFT_594957 [Pyrenochaeta sp. DS3sAY3a]|nr:hypothetical protein IQ07DRAFT_594957 [Pyrenochaeta sp. DS3sAY3a]